MPVLQPPGTRDSQRQALPVVARAAAIIVIAMGAAQILFWLADAAWLEAIFPRLFDMKFNTAIALIASGAGLLCLMTERPNGALAAGAIVSLIGGLSLLQHLTGQSLGIDRLLFQPGHHNSGPFPGRISPGTSLALTLMGGALILLSRAPRQSISFFVGGELLGFLIFALGAGGAIGYILGVEVAYNWGSMSRMAPHTSFALMTIGAGTLALSWARQETQIASMPLWVPAMLCFAVLLIDVSTPRGVATAIAYIPLVFCGLWFQRPHATFVFAAIATALSIAAVAAKAPSDVPAWFVTANRTLAIGAIWLVAALIYMRGRSEAALSASDSKLQAVVNHTVDGLITIDEKGTIDSFNPACERIFGYTAAEVIGQNVKILMPEPYRAEHDGYLAHHLRTGQARIIGTAGRELTARRKDGTTFPIDLSISAFNLEGRRHFSGIMRDITTRKEAEEELVRYTKALERSNKDLDDFAYIASHDLKEPLRGLANNATFLKEDYAEKLDEDGVQRLDRLSFLTKRLDNLISDLLYFSRIGRQDLAVMPTDMNAVIDDIKTLMETTLQERNAKIVIPKRLPTVVCDKPRTTEVFRNLITNAVKYNRAPEKIVEVGYHDTLATAHGVETEVFYVKDNGIGIEPEFHEDIFRIFKRLNDERDAERGTGVGLTFVRKIVERHGGRVWVDSTLGAGATFYFTLKHAKAHVAA